MMVPTAAKMTHIPGILASPAKGKGERAGARGPKDHKTPAIVI